MKLLLELLMVLWTFILICNFLPTLSLANLTAQDGMDVSLQNFEKVTIDGNVAATILGTAAADTLVGDAGADTITGRGGADTLQADLDLTHLFSLQVIQVSQRLQLIRLLIFQQELIKLILLP